MMENGMRGDRLRDLREAAHLTQEELAQQLEISEPQVWRYEKGDSAPRADVLLKLASYFNVSSDYLLGRSSDPGMYVAGELSVKERAVISAWRRGERLEAMRVIANDE
jgi:transcriptional regulator with XRE-family HTH domain